MINVSIAALGSNVVDVELEDGATVLDAIDAARDDNGRRVFSRDAVSTVKRNGQELDFSATVNEGDILMVVNQKITGGNVVVASGKCVTSCDGNTNGKIAIEGTTVFDVAKYLAHRDGYSADDIFEVRNGAGETVALTSDAVQQEDYTIVIKKECCGNETCGE